MKTKNVVPTAPAADSGQPVADTISSLVSAASNPVIRVIELHVLGKHVQLRSTTMRWHAVIAKFAPFRRIGNSVKTSARSRSSVAAWYRLSKRPPRDAAVE